MNLLIVGSNSLNDRKDILIEALQESDQKPTKFTTTSSTEKLVSAIAMELNIPYYITEEFDKTRSNAETNIQTIKNADYVIFLIDESDPFTESYRDLVFECMNCGRCFITKLIKTKLVAETKARLEINDGAKEN